MSPFLQELSKEEKEAIDKEIVTLKGVSVCNSLKAQLAEERERDDRETES